MILLQHLAEGASAVALAVLLGQLTHLNFRQIALDCLFEEFLAGLVLGESGRAGDDSSDNAGHQQLDAHDAILQFSCWRDREVVVQGSGPRFVEA